MSNPASSPAMEAPLRARPSREDLLTRIAALEARNAELLAASTQREARLARLEERVSRVAGNAAAITPSAASDTGTRTELGKVKDALADLADGA